MFSMERSEQGQINVDRKVGEDVRTDTRTM